MENLALYTRLMKYGHLQTDPNEENTWAHGDPAAGIQYHPALAEEDWVKFGGGLKHPDERFVDFRRVRYVRENWHDKSLRAMAPEGNGSGLWQETRGIRLLDWLDFINGPAPEGNVRNVNGFVSAGSDALRTIEFVHNYAIPEDLGWDFGRQGKN